MSLFPFSVFMFFPAVCRHCPAPALPAQRACARDGLNTSTSFPVEFCIWVTARVLKAASRSLCTGTFTYSQLGQSCVRCLRGLGSRLPQTQCCDNAVVYVFTSVHVPPARSASRCIAFGSVALVSSVETLLEGFVLAWGNNNREYERVETTHICHSYPGCECA